MVKKLKNPGNVGTLIALAVGAKELKDKTMILEVWVDFLPCYDPTRSSHDLFHSIVQFHRKIINK